MENLTKTAVKTTLSRLYGDSYAEYAFLLGLAYELFNENESYVHEVISRKASDKSFILIGIKEAAQALGIGEDEFMEAVNGGNAKSQEVDA